MIVFWIFFIDAIDDRWLAMTFDKCSISASIELLLVEEKERKNERKLVKNNHRLILFLSPLFGLHIMTQEDTHTNIEANTSLVSIKQKWRQISWMKAKHRDLIDVVSMPLFFSVRWRLAHSSSFEKKNRKKTWSHPYVFFFILVVVVVVRLVRVFLSGYERKRAELVQFNSFSLHLVRCRIDEITSIVLVVNRKNIPERFELVLLFEFFKYHWD